MGAFAIGDVVVIPFPYADFSKFKKRPALVVGKADFNNLILCQITSNSEASKKAITLHDDDLVTGSLLQVSYIRPDKLFTVERSIILSELGSLHKNKVASVLSDIREIFSQSLL